MSERNIFKELVDIDITDKIKQKGRHSYLSWANAWAQIKFKHPTAQRTIYESPETGLNFFTDGRTAYVKVGITVANLEHIDYLPVMDNRNVSMTIDKITSMNINTSIQRSTAKAIAMHGLGLTLWAGEDLVSTAMEEEEPPMDLILDIGDDNWATVVGYMASNKELGLQQLVTNLETRYKITSAAKKELAKHV